jgi:uncharacterized protein (TIGR03067 family)
MRPRTLVASLALLLWPTAPHAAANDRPATPTQLAALVRQLGDDSYSKREAASKVLGALGAPALPALRRAAASADPEVRRRAARLVTRAHQQALERELTKLEGTWAAESETEDGKTTALGGDTRITIRFERAGAGCQIRHESGQSLAGLTGTWRVVGATATPPKIDLVFSPTRTFRGAYRIDGDRLTLCGVDRSESESQRPAAFEAKGGDGRYLIRLKRVKGPAPEPARVVQGPALSR